MSSTPEHSSPPSAPSPSAPPGDQAREPKKDRPRPAPMDAPRLSDEMNAEIDAAMKDLEAASAAQPKKPRAHGHDDVHPTVGSARPAIRGPRVIQAGREQRPGKVVSIGPTDVFVELGPKELGVVPRSQWPEDKGLPAKDDVIDVVVNSRDSDGALLCSRPGAVQKADWEMLQPGQVIDAKVTGVNKGGLDLEVAGHRAFMPAGQVALEHIADLSVFVGEKVTCKVTRVDRSGRGNIVLSRREILHEQRREQAEKLKSSLTEGQVVEGTVRKIMAFGCFVDLGGIDGLVHVSDLTHDRAGHGEKFVGRYVKEGERVRVQILKIDWDAKRLSLGIKQIQADPFAVAVGEIKDGAEVNGRVTKLMEFGAFVELAPGVEGLVHISELAWRRVGKVEEVLKQDEVVKVKVLKVDPESRRVSLSIKATLPPPEPIERPAGPGGFRGKGKRGERDTRTPEQILKVTPELRRLREKFGAKQLKGGIG
jgi:ribosomal protein S1